MLITPHCFTSAARGGPFAPPPLTSAGKPAAPRPENTPLIGGTSASTPPPSVKSAAPPPPPLISMPAITVDPEPENAGPQLSPTIKPAGEGKEPGTGTGPFISFNSSCITFSTISSSTSGTISSSASHIHELISPETPVIGSGEFPAIFFSLTEKRWRDRKVRKAFGGTLVLIVGVPAWLELTRKKKVVVVLTWHIFSE
nr:hypothetical protein Iba_chr10cCG12220 [Ipomoea batatas]